MSQPPPPKRKGGGGAPTPTPKRPSKPPAAHLHSRASPPSTEPAATAAAAPTATAATAAPAARSAAPALRALSSAPEDGGPFASGYEFETVRRPMPPRRPRVVLLLLLLRRRPGDLGLPPRVRRRCSLACMHACRVVGVAAHLARRGTAPEGRSLYAALTQPHSKPSRLHH